MQASASVILTGERTLIPWVHLDTAPVPGEQDVLRLMQRGDEFSIVVGTIELMNNRLRWSEQARPR